MALAVPVRVGTSGWLVAGVLVALAGELVVAAVLGVGEIANDHTAWRGLLAGLGLALLVLLSGLVWNLVRRFGSVDESLQGESERFALTAAISAEWLWQASPELVLTYCSPAAAAMLGYEPAELVGRSLFDLMDSSEVARAHSIWVNALARDSGWKDVELWWRRSDGEPVQLQGTAVPMHDRQGRLIGYQGARRPAGNAATSTRLRELSRRIDETLDTHAVSIALQPIVDLAAGDLFACEALARFPDGRNPVHWFADAHKTGKGVELELEAARRAIELLDQLPDGTRIGINASPALVVDDRFLHLLEGSPVKRLAIELTEHAHVSSYKTINDSLSALRQQGLRLSIDDTGAGYASFSHVLQLKPDSIKIDRSWLSEVEHDPARQALCSAAVSLADSLNAIVIAEGIETESQLDVVTSLGITHAQGYLLARPSSDPQAWTRWHTRSWRQLPLAS